MIKKIPFVLGCSLSKESFIRAISFQSRGYSNRNSLENMLRMAARRWKIEMTVCRFGVNICDNKPIDMIQSEIYLVPGAHAQKKTNSNLIVG